MSFIPPELAQLFERIQGEIAAEQAVAKAREDPRTLETMVAALFPAARLRLLAALFGQADRRFHIRQLIRFSGGGVGRAHELLADLENAGWLSASRFRGRKLYQADPKAPFHAELCGMFRKGAGLASPIRKALAPLEASIEGAFVHEGFSRWRDGVARLQLVVVSDSALAGLDDAVRDAEYRLDRRVDPLECGKDDLRAGGYFISSILERPRVWVIGSEAWLAEVLDDQR
jgi:hypothetical protein